MREDYKNTAWLQTVVIVDEHGITRSTRNGQIPSDGILERLSLTEEEMTAHSAARDIDLDAHAAEYERRRCERTRDEIAEQWAEARAAHGPGVELVNIFTGERQIT